MADRYVLATTVAAHIEERLHGFQTVEALLAAIMECTRYDPESIAKLCRVGMGWAEMERHTLRAHQANAAQVVNYVEQDERPATP
jgi:hypothetical protein